jgi:CRISPR-associated protein Csb2
MLAVHVRLLHGTIRAGSPHDTVMAGTSPEGEWPPSPARLFSALVAADGTRDRCEVTTGEELGTLEAAPPPTIHADRVEDVLVAELEPRFVVKDEQAKKSAQEYPARTSAEVRPGLRASPRHPTVRYVWDVDLPEPHVDALARRAARIGYLGCADSPVQVTVTTETPNQNQPAQWHPGAHTGVELPVPYPGFTDALDQAFDAWSAGEAMRRSWIPNRWERYSTATDATRSGHPTVIWMGFDHRIDGRHSLAATETLRAAILDQADRLLGSDSGRKGSRAPWILHGHDIPGDVPRPYQLVRYLPLADVGSRYSTGALHGCAVWLPPGADPEIVELVRAAAASIRVLNGHGVRVGVALRGDESRPWSTCPERWSGRSRRWFSATPAVAERGRKGGLTAADVRAWFRHADHPEPVAVRLSPVPTHPGVVRLRPREVHRHANDRHPFVWLDVAFAKPVAGPMCVGRARSFGMGLLAPERGSIS